MADQGQESKRTPHARCTDQPHGEGGMSPSRYSGGEFASPHARSGSSETPNVRRGTYEAVENSRSPLESSSSPVENCSNYGNKSAESVTPDTRLCDTGLNIDLSNAYPVENKQELLEKFGVIKNPTGVAMLRTKKQRKYVEGEVAGKSRRRAATPELCRQRAAAWRLGAGRAASSSTVASFARIHGSQWSFSVTLPSEEG